MLRLGSQRRLDRYTVDFHHIRAKDNIASSSTPAASLGTRDTYGRTRAATSGGVADGSAVGSPYHCRGSSTHVVVGALVGAFVLLHVVLASECFAAGRTLDVLFARVLLAMAGSVTGSGEGVAAMECCGMGARVFLFLWVGGIGTGCGFGPVGAGLLAGEAIGLGSSL